MKFNLLRKFASRKFWIAVIGFVSVCLIVCNFPSLSSEQAAAIASGCAALASYIIGESIADSSNKSK